MRSLHIDHTVRDIFVIIKIVRQNELAELWQWCGNDLCRGIFSVENLLTDFAEFEVAFSCDHIIGQLDDLLLLGLITDLRPAQNDLDLRLDPLEDGNDFSRLRDIPNVNAQSDDFRTQAEERLGNFNWPLVDVELAQHCVGTQTAHVGQQIAQAECGMNVFGIQRGEDDFRHSSSSAQWRRPRTLPQRPDPNQLSPALPPHSALRLQAGARRSLSPSGTDISQDS